MAHIALKVDDAIGKIYQGLSPEGRRRFSQIVSMLIKRAANESHFAEYSKFLDEIGNEAVKNGLTAEILSQLLSEQN